MSRPIPASRPYPTTWTQNTFAERGWDSPMVEPYRLWIAGALFGGAVALAAGYGALGWMFRHAADPELGNS